MKTYGFQRYDAITCRYGCCTTKYGKHSDWRSACDKSRRKTARQEAKKQIFSELINNSKKQQEITYA